MKKNPKRVIIDTNLWISFLINNEYSKLKTLLLKRKLRLIVSEELIEEFIEVAFRPKFEKYVEKEDVFTILSVLNDYSDFYEVINELSICRDPKDDFLINLAVQSQADYLVSGDKDLLVLEKINKTKIVTVKTFLDNMS